MLSFRWSLWYGGLGSKKARLHVVGVVDSIGTLASEVNRGSISMIVVVDAIQFIHSVIR